MCLDGTFPVKKIMIHFMRFVAVYSLFKAKLPLKCIHKNIITENTMKIITLINFNLK